MRKHIISSLAAAALVLSACGGGGGDLSGDQAKAVDLLVSSAEAGGVEVDKGCVEKVAEKLSDADAKAIVDSANGDDPDLGGAPEELQSELFSCVNMDSMIDSMIDEIGDQPGVDKDCLRGILEDLSPDELAAGEMPDGLLDCIEISG